MADGASPFIESVADLRGQVGLFEELAIARKSEVAAAVRADATHGPVAEVGLRKGLAVWGVADLEDLLRLSAPVRQSILHNLALDSRLSIPYLNLLQEALRR